MTYSSAIDVPIAILVPEILYTQAFGHISHFFSFGFGLSLYYLSQTYPFWLTFI